MSEFTVGLFLGVGLGLVLGLVVIPITVDVWVALLRRRSVQR